MSSSNSTSSSGSESTSGSGYDWHYEGYSSDMRTHYPDVNNSDYSSEGASSLGSYGLWSDNNYAASTDSGRSNSTWSTNSNWSQDSGSSGTSYGSASTWGSTIGRGSESGYEGDIESAGEQ